MTHFTILLPLVAGIAILLAACGQPQTLAKDTAKKEDITASATLVSLAGDTLQPITRTEAEWRQMLSPRAYKVLREAGTERAFTGELWDNHEDGIYVCGGCELPLFDSATKFESGTGWPSFFKPIAAAHVTDVEDNTYGMRRVENVCSRCKGHLGHVFNDGPEPTGLRYCMNSVSLKFVPRAEAVKR